MKKISSACISRDKKDCYDCTKNCSEAGNRKNARVKKEMVKSGTKEWSDVSFNCIKGCGNNCRYCYAAAMNKRFTRKGTTPHPWERETFIDRMKEAGRKYKGVVMFPTSHDITRHNYEHYAKHLKALLKAGNKVLVVSKMSEIVENNFQRDFRDYACFPGKDSQLEVRITITSQMDDISAYFEPKAPLFRERLEVLKNLFYAGFHTSVSIEPFLTCPELIIEKVMLHCRGQIWIGGVTGYKLNNKNGMEAFLALMYSDIRMKVIYEKYKDNPKISFKESFMRRLK